MCSDDGDYMHGMSGIRGVVLLNPNPVEDIIMYLCLYCCNLSTT